MNALAIVGRRLKSQRISGSAASTPDQVVRGLGAMQAQEYPVAKWSIGMRTAGGSSDAALDQALADGLILRTHILRPTWHFVLPADIRWMQQLTAARVQARMALYQRRLGLDEAIHQATNRALSRILDGGKRLTRREILPLLQDRGIAVDGERLGHLMLRAELDLLVCSGGLKGRQHTYALLDEIVPAASPMPREVGLAELTRRYFTGHGPATATDFAWWSGLTMADVRRGLELVRGQLESVMVADRTLWFASIPDVPADPSPTAHLIQGYDEFIIGYSQSRHLVDLASLYTAAPVRETLPLHAVLLDGQVVARWRRLPGPKSTVIQVQLGRQLAPPEFDALKRGVDRYARFLGVPLSLQVP
ncbi:MAG: winged helix DNA-binding domain-containing protein [Chloroflexota bacterium]|nr:winged helix DNA-binding domain-containing protein [Chloroflexota bacterium]